MFRYTPISIILILLLLAPVVHAQDGRKVNIGFKPFFHHQPVLFDPAYYRISGTDSLSFETLKCYISGIVFYKDDKPVFREKNSYHLLDAADEQTMHIGMVIPAGIDYNSISFHLGIDSITNTAGILTGDLDPVKGMYWAWQSGYINFKLEGTSNICPTRKNSFNFHLGGYLPPNNALQTVKLGIKNGTDISIAITLDKFINAIDLKKQNSVMIPGKEAVTLSQLVAQTFETAP